MIPAIVLAAGGSTRMGRPKALLPVGPGGETFLDRVIRTLEEGGIEETIVVLGAEASGIRDAVRADPRTRFVVNPRPERGQLSSFLEGLRVADRPGVGAVMAALVDVPLVAPATVRALLDAYRHTRSLITRPVRAGQHGHPVIFDRALFDELRHADPSIGVKAIVRAHAADTRDVEVDDEGAFVDVDTPGEYRRLTSRD